MKVYIGCDSIGYSLKAAVVNFIREKLTDVELVDCGCFSESDNTAYPVFAEKVCRNVLADEGSRGILICGTGIGMNITANKIKGIYAAVCHDTYSCERSILSNNANVLCMGRRIISEFAAQQIVKQWLSLTFVPSPSSAKIAMIYDLEKNGAIEANN